MNKRELRKAAKRKARQKAGKKQHLRVGDDALKGSKFLKAFLCDHDSFITIDNLLHKIKHLGKLDYKQGVGYVISLVEWCEEWRTLADRLALDGEGAGYSDKALRLLISHLEFNVPIRDELIGHAEKEVDFQRQLYRTLSMTEAGKALVQEVIAPRETANEIAKYAGLMAEKIHNTTYAVDERERAKVLAEIKAKLDAKTKIEAEAVYRDSNYRFTL